MKKTLLFLNITLGLILCGVASAQPTRRILDSTGTEVDFSTEAKQDTIIGNQTDGDQTTSLVDPDDSTRKAEFDNKLKVPIFITPEHHKVHECESFERHITTSNSTVDSMNVAFKTAPGTELAHMLFGFSSSDEILFEITESAIWTQGTGTALTIYNHDRNCNDSSTVILEDKNQPTFTASNQVIKDVTGVSGGTVFEAQYTYNASLGASTKAETRASTHEWNLKANETYVIKMTATDGNCKMSVDLHWYENTSE